MRHLEDYLALSVKFVDSATKRLTSGVVVVLSDVEGRQFGVCREMPGGCRVLYSCGGAVKFIPFGSVWLYQQRGGAAFIVVPQDFVVKNKMPR